MILPSFSFLFLPVSSFFFCSKDTYCCPYHTLHTHICQSVDMPVPYIVHCFASVVFVPCGHINRRAGIIDAKPHGNSSPHMYIRSPRTLGRSCFGAATLHALSFSTYCSWVCVLDLLPTFLSIQCVPADSSSSHPLRHPRHHC